MFINSVFIVWFICFCDADQEKIFGGRFARKGEFPSAVAIVVGKIICGGTIVVLDKVLTAAHCMMNKTSGVPKPTSGYKIYGGTLRVPIPPLYRRGEGLQERNISEVKIHEGFESKNDGTSYHDIALIILNKPFVQTETLSAARYPSMNEKEFLDAWNALSSSKKSCVGIGWGTTFYKNGTKKGPPVASNISEDLKAVDLSPLEPKNCSIYVHKDDKDMTEQGEVCVSSNKEKGESLCKGDSGSPLFCDGYVFGHARASIGCANRTVATFYLLHGPYIDYFGLRPVYYIKDHPDFGSLLLPNARVLFIISSMLLLILE